MFTPQKTNISIIVPIYNASRHIPFLIDSVKKQTYTNWELLLVDDGSKDNSLEVCNKYKEEDSRIKVLHQENQGPSAARNKGILAATGEWITFVDADDSLLDCFLSSMANMIHDEIDIVFAGYVVVEANKNHIFTYTSTFYNGKDEVKKSIANSNILHRCCPWGKMFRRSVMIDNNMLFDSQLAHSEDRLFVYDYLLHTRGIATTSAIGYLYDSTQTGTLKNKVLSIEKLKLRQQRLTSAAHKLIEHFNLKGEELFPIAKHLLPMFANAIQGYYYLMGNTKETYAEQLRFYEEHFDHELYKEIKNIDLWKQFSCNNTMLMLTMDCQFKKINSKMSVIDKKIAVIKMLRKYSKIKSIPQNFVNAISILNKKIAHK